MLFTDEREIDLVLFSLLVTKDSSQQVLILLLKFCGVTELNESSRFKDTCQGAPGGHSG